MPRLTAAANAVCWATGFSSLRRRIAYAKKARLAETPGALGDFNFRFFSRQRAGHERGAALFKPPHALHSGADAGNQNLFHLTGHNGHDVHEFEQTAIRRVIALLNVRKRDLDQIVSADADGDAGFVLLEQINRARAELSREQTIACRRTATALDMA